MRVFFLHYLSWEVNGAVAFSFKVFFGAVLGIETGQSSIHGNLFDYFLGRHATYVLLITFMILFRLFVVTTD